MSHWQCTVTLPDLAEPSPARFDALATVLGHVEDETPDVSDTGLTASPGDGLTIAMVVTGPGSAFTAAGVAARFVRAGLGRWSAAGHWAGPRVRIEVERRDSEEAAA